MKKELDHLETVWELVKPCGLWNQLQSAENPANLKLRCGGMHEVGTHGRCLLGPCSELDSGEGLAGQRVVCMVYKVDRCAHHLVLTCKEDPPLPPQEQPAHRHRQGQGLQASLPKTGFQLPCPRWGSGKMRGDCVHIHVEWIFIIPFSVDRRKIKEEKDICWKK